MENSIKASDLIFQIFELIISGISSFDFHFIDVLISCVKSKSDS